jgi:Family of unknown function (DUF7002)
VDPEAFAARYPALFHMAEVDSWPSIQQHGLLSTSALLDLFEIPQVVRTPIEACHRPESVSISHPVHGDAVIRDQKAMSDGGLRRALSNELKPEQWYRLLNGKVFFWVSEERLDRLLTARAYRDRAHIVLAVDTRELLQRHLPAVTLSPINSGATKPAAALRGSKTFLDFDEYPFEFWSKRRSGRDVVVELAVERAVPRIHEFIVRVDLRIGAERQLVWAPTS